MLQKLPLRQLILLTIIIVLFIACSSPPQLNLKTKHSQTSKVEFITDVVYGHDFGMAMTFDVYKPLKPNGAGVILINSGGWKSPSEIYKVKQHGAYRFATTKELFELKSWHILYPKLLVDNGFTVFEVMHGSGTKFSMSELVSHIRRAVRFIKFNANDYAVDSSRIGLWGGSASGHLSLLVGLSPEIGLEKTTENWEKLSAKVSAIVSFSAPTDLSRFVADNPKALKYWPVLQLTQEQYQEYSPVLYVSSDDTPTLIMHGNADDVIPIVHGETIFKKLQAAGVTTKYIEFEDTSHSPTIEQSQRGVAEALKWFEKHLGN